MRKSKYLLIIILTVFMSIPYVDAEEYNTCYDEYKIADNLTFTMVDNYHTRMKVKLPLSYEDTKTYYVKFFNLDLTHDYKVGSMHYFYDSEGKTLASVTNKYINISEMSEDGVVSYSSKNNLQNVAYFYMDFYVYETNNFYKPNTNVILTLSDYELTSCPIIEPEEPETPVINSTLADFYTIFNSKLKLLSSYSLENNYLFSAIGILILFTVLYLFLYLFNRGGYKR